MTAHKDGDAWKTKIISMKDLETVAIGLGIHDQIPNHGDGISDIQAAVDLYQDRDFRESVLGKMYHANADGTCGMRHLARSA